MIYLNNSVSSKNYSRLYSNNCPTARADKPSDFVSFSANTNTTKENETKKRDNTKLLTYIIGGVVIAVATIFAIKKLKSTKNINDIPKKPNDINEKPPSPPINQDVKNANVTPSNTESENILNNKTSEKNKNITEQQPSAPSQDANLMPANTGNGNMSTGKPHEQNKHIDEKKSSVSTQKIISSEEKLKESLNRAYDQKTEEFAVHPELKNKKALIREVMPELYGRNCSEVVKDNSDIHKILLLITPENKDFIFKQALPTIEKHKEALDIGNNSEFIDMLKVVNADNLDCFELFAKNKEKYKIKNRFDVANLLKGITKDNKGFALEELIPYLLENSEKYEISRGGQMAQFFSVVTPQNKDFMFQEVLPEVLDKGKQLNLGISDALKIAKHVDKDNFKTISKLAQEPDKYDFKDESDFLDINKLCSTLFEKKE